MRKTFQQLIKHLLTPDTVEVNLGAIKLKYSDEMREDVALVLATLRSKRVLFAKIDHELWNYVFESLRNIRKSLTELSGKLHTKGPSDVKAAVDFMVEVVAAYLAEHETDYTRFMQEPNIHQLAPAHLERNWPNLGNAALDLISLRKVIFAAIENLNQYASTGEVLDWEPPQDRLAEHWYRYAQKRRLCPTCGWNMFYAYDEDCPVCPSDKTVFRLRPQRYANTVQVAGTFNNWKPQKMKTDFRDYSMVYRVKLPPGTYEYKFVVDGGWLVDPNNPKSTTDVNGNINSVIEISPINAT